LDLLGEPGGCGSSLEQPEMIAIAIKAMVYK